MKRLTVPVAFAALLFVAACDQSAQTSKTDTAEKPGAVTETKPADKPTAEKPAAGTPAATPSTPADKPAAAAEDKKQPGPCADDRKKFCADKSKDDVTACLKANQAQLSAVCRTSLKL